MFTPLQNSSTIMFLTFEPSQTLHFSDTYRRHYFRFFNLFSPFPDDFSSLLGSLNYIVTVLNLRTKGMTMSRLPLTIWAFFITAIIGVVSFPVLLSAALLLIMDRSFGTSFFLSDIFIQGEVLHYQGGSPVLYEHLFWFLGHPEVYIVLCHNFIFILEVGRCFITRCLIRPWCRIR